MSSSNSGIRLPYVFQPKGRENWYVRMRWDGREVVRIAGRTEAQARSRAKLAYSLRVQGASLDEVLRDVFGDVDGDRLTFVELAALYRDHIVSTGAKKASTLKSDTNRLAGVCRAAWAKRFVATVSSRDIARWFDERAKVVTPATLNRDLSAASAVFSYAVQMGYVDANPVKDIRRASETGNKRDLYLSQQQIAEMLDHAPEYFRPLLLCAVATGMRRGELLSLQWADVDLAGRTLCVRAEVAKTSKERRVPMCAPLAETLSEMKAARGVFDINARGGPVFVWRDGKAITDTRHRKAWNKTLAAWEGHPDGLRFHDLRHTAASLLINSGNDLFVVGKILGHSTPVTTSRYAHLVLDLQRDAVESLDSVLPSIAI